MSEKIKEELIKSIFQFYDIKQNSKFIVFFNLNNNDKNSHLKINVSNGINVWVCLIDEKFLNNFIKIQFESKTLNEFLEILLNSLKTDQFELNEIIQESNELIEFKTKNFIFLLNESKSNKDEIRNLVFMLYDKYLKLETELKRLNNRADLTVSSTQANNLGKQKPEASSDNLKKFSINSNLVNKKTGISFINKLKKLRKTPEGVKFDDDDNDDDDDNSDVINRNNASDSNSQNSNDV